MKQGCTPGVSLWTGSMGAENSLTQKASYKTSEDKRETALLDGGHMDRTMASAVI